LQQALLYLAIFALFFERRCFNTSSMGLIGIDGKPYRYTGMPSM